MRIRRRRWPGARCVSNYITQPKSRPPSFVVFCTRADAVPDAYKRYLVNSNARGVRFARNANSSRAARKRQPVQGTGKKKTLSASGRRPEIEKFLFAKTIEPARFTAFRQAQRENCLRDFLRCRQRQRIDAREGARIHARACRARAEQVRAHRCRRAF